MRSQHNQGTKASCMSGAQETQQKLWRPGAGNQGWHTNIHMTCAQQRAVGLKKYGDLGCLAQCDTWLMPAAAVLLQIAQAHDRSQLAGLPAALAGPLCSCPEPGTPGQTGPGCTDAQAAAQLLCHKPTREAGSGFSQWLV